MERDIIYYHIAIQQIEQLNKQSIFIKLNDHYHIYKKHKSKCPYDVEETNKPEILRHTKKLELKANMDSHTHTHTHTHTHIIYNL